MPDLKEKSFIVFINISESHRFVDEVESNFLKEDCEQSEEHVDEEDDEELELELEPLLDELLFDELLGLVVVSGCR